MASKSNQIRVGIIRCDTHGFWYSHLFDKPDPEMMRKNHRGCHYYFYKRADPSRLRSNPVPGMTITRVFDEDDSTKAEALSEAFGGRPKVCKSYAEVSDGADLVYIADCNFEGKDHLRYATPGLKKGVPHFVDKPFAFTLKDARAMLRLARKHNTAVMCASLLRFSPQLERFGKHLADIAPVARVDVPSIGPGLAAVFHAVATVQNIMGFGCEWVESMGPTIYDVFRLHYPGPKGGTEVIIMDAIGSSPGGVTYSSTYHHCELFLASAYGANGAMHAPRVGDYEYPYGGTRIVRLAKQMALTKKPPVDYDSMLELMEMIEAARLAHNKGKRVTLKSLR